MRLLKERTTQHEAGISDFFSRASFPLTPLLDRERTEIEQLLIPTGEVAGLHQREAIKRGSSMGIGFDKLEI